MKKKKESSFIKANRCPCLNMINERELDFCHLSHNNCKAVAALICVALPMHNFNRIFSMKVVSGYAVNWNFALKILPASVCLTDSIVEQM